VAEGTRTQFQQMLERLSRALPEIYFEIVEDEESPEGFYIALLSTGPDHTPDVQQLIPKDWVFSGWRNPDQRNNLAVVRRRRQNGATDEEN
jgi:hypothetical protein